MGGGWSTPRPDRFTPGKDTRYPLYSRLGGPQGRSGGGGKSRPPPGFDPRTVQPVAVRCTDWAIAAHVRFGCTIGIDLSYLCHFCPSHVLWFRSPVSFVCFSPHSLYLCLSLLLVQYFSPPPFFTIVTSFFSIDIIPCLILPPPPPSPSLLFMFFDIVYSSIFPQTR